MAPTPPNGRLTIAARNHSDPAVARVGFDLDHPYVEQCWSAVVGPSAVLLLRRLPALWRQAEPTVVDPDGLAGSLGLGASSGRRSRLNRTLERLVRYRFATWTEPGQELAVNVKVAPLPPHQLERIPAWSREAHERLLSAHIAALAERIPPLTSSSVTDITARLDRVQHMTGTRTGTLGR